MDLEALQTPHNPSYASHIDHWGGPRLWFGVFKDTHTPTLAEVAPTDMCVVWRRPGGGPASTGQLCAT